MVRTIKKIISLQSAVKHPLKRWTERMWNDCFMNNYYYGKRIKYSKIFETYNGSTYQLGPEDFLLDSFCILGACECNAENCLRLNDDVQSRVIEQEKLTLDNFLPKMR